jgi:hypothetical protein
MQHTGENSWVTEEETVATYRPLYSRLAPVPSLSFLSPSLHENHFNLLLPMVVFTPSHYSPIPCCTMLSFLFFFSFPNIFFFHTCTSHFLESRNGRVFFTFLYVPLEVFLYFYLYIRWPILQEYKTDDKYTTFCTYLPIT